MKDPQAAKTDPALQEDPAIISQSASTDAARNDPEVGSAAGSINHHPAKKVADLIRKREQAVREAAEDEIRKIDEEIRELAQTPAQRAQTR